MNMKKGKSIVVSAGSARNVAMEVEELISVLSTE